MKIKPYLDRLASSKEFKSFTRKNPNAYFSAGFFVIDLESGKNVHQIDYFIPETKKMMTFILDSKDIESKLSDMSNDNIPDIITEKINIDLDTLKGIVEDEMKNNMVTKKIQKIIAILHKLDGKLVWNLNCITTDMSIIKIHIADEDHSILKFDKINIFDVVKKL
ncbi:MAG: hypothetical protein QXI33_02210 [Candidatus Pacearchaeota archaeon]